MTGRALALALVALVTAVGAADAQEPAPVPAPPPAQVGAVTITVDRFDSWFRAAALGQTEEPDPDLTRKERRSLTRQVMQFLIQLEWVRGEAALQGISVSAERVWRSFRAQRKAAFETERAYRRWLRGSGMTEAMLFERVESDLLQQKLTTRVAVSPPISHSQVRAYMRSHPRRFREMEPAQRLRAARRIVRSLEQQRALDAFIKDFRRRWRAVTVCGPGYVVSECSNGPPPRFG